MAFFWHGFFFFAINEDRVILRDKIGSEWIGDVLGDTLWWSIYCDWIDNVLGETLWQSTFLLLWRILVNLSAQCKMTFFEFVFRSYSLNLVIEILVVEEVEFYYCFLILVVEILVVKGFVFRSILLFVFDNGVTRLLIGRLLKRIGFNIDNFY